MKTKSEKPSGIILKVESYLFNAGKAAEHYLEIVVRKILDTYPAEIKYFRMGNGLAGFYTAQNQLIDSKIFPEIKEVYAILDRYDAAFDLTSIRWYVRRQLLPKGVKKAPKLVKK